MSARTGAEIKTHLEETFRTNALCMGARFAITIRRVEDRRRRATGAWYADVRVSGKAEDAEACDEAVSDVIAQAQEDFELAGES